MVRVGGFVLQPFRQVVGVGQPTEQNHIGGPVVRTVFTSVCIPATANPTSLQGLAPAVELPLSQQDQLAGWGSLYRSKMTELSFLKALATEAQKAGAWS